MALPTSENLLNINLASASLLRTLNTDDLLVPLAETQISGWLEELAQANFNDLAAFTNSPTTQAIQVGDKTINTEGLGVASRYVQLETDMQYGQRLYLFTALLERSEAELTLIQRSYGVL